MTSPLDGLVVAHVTTVHHEHDTRIRTKECPSVAAAGARVVLVAPDDGAPDLDDGIEVHHIPRRSKLARVARSGLDAVRAVRAIGPDLVHIHDPELLAVVPLLRAATRAPVIYDVHEVLPKQIRGRNWIPGPLRAVAAGIADRLEPLLARTCQGFVLVDDWSDRFRNRPHAVVANLPIRAEFTGDGGAREREATPTVAYVGMVMAERGALALTHAVNRIERHVRLVLAGPLGSEDLAEAIRAADAKGRVELPGRIDRDAVVDLLTSADVGALLLKPSPAYDVARATKLYEYLLAGLPILLSQSPAHREFAGEFGGCTLVDFDDVEATSAALEALLFDEAIAATERAEAEAARARVPDWEGAAAALVGLYSEVRSS